MIHRLHTLCLSTYVMYNTQCALEAANLLLNRRGSTRSEAASLAPNPKFVSNVLKFIVVVYSTLSLALHPQSIITITFQTFCTNRLNLNYT